MLTIRKLLPSDNPLTVGSIFVEGWRYAYKGIVSDEYLSGLSAEQWAKKLEMPGRHTIVAELDGELIGTVGYGNARDADYVNEGEIYAIYLLPKYIRYGYGTALLKAVCSELRPLGYSELYLWVLKENSQAIGFYEKMGFTFTGETKDADIGGTVFTELRYSLLLFPQRRRGAEI